jgi:hypothetical protein
MIIKSVRVEVHERSRNRIYSGNDPVFLKFFLPILIWWSLRRYWTPKTRRSYALKFAFWPLIIFSSQLAGPMARAIFGVPSRYSMETTSTLQGVAVLVFLTAPIFLGIGYYIARKKFQ